MNSGSLASQLPHDIDELFITRSSPKAIIINSFVSHLSLQVLHSFFHFSCVSVECHATALKAKSDDEKNSHHVCFCKRRFISDSSCEQRTGEYALWCFNEAFVLHPNWAMKKTDWWVSGEPRFIANNTSFVLGRSTACLCFPVSGSREKFHFV